MGFFTEGERASLSINDMIFHLVGEAEFVPQHARAVEHEEFFLDRIRDCDVSPVFAFDPSSQTKAQAERIASGVDTFEIGCQNLAREFSRVHLGRVRDGAFFVFRLSTNDLQSQIITLLKFDYHEALEQSAAEQGGLLRRIVHALIADKKAIQKSAHIRVVNGVAEASLSAFDRMKRQPEIGDYFAAFLHATRNRTDQQLNNDMVNAIRDTLAACRDVLPERDVPRAFRRVKDILRDRQEISDDAIEEAIIAAAGNPDSEDVRAELQQRTRRKLRSSKLEGLVFPPDAQVLKRPPLRKVKTTEGITLTYPEDLEGASLKRMPRPEGGETITIETAMITEDTVVARNTRSSD
jgi:hypothetical protein